MPASRLTVIAANDMMVNLRIFEPRVQQAEAMIAGYQTPSTGYVIRVTKNMIFHF